MNGDLQRIGDALQFVPVGGHDERVRVAFMLKSELGDTGRDVWDEWRDGRGDDEAVSVWKSASETGPLKIGTLFHEAKANGWRDDGTHQKPTSEELAERRRIAAERAAKEEIETARKHADAAQEAKLIYGVGRRDEAQEHPYAMKKRVSLFSLVRRGAWPKRGWNDALIVPLSNADGKLSTLQAINTDGEKDYLAGGCKRGCFHPFGTLRGASFVQIGEGMATVAAGVDATDWPAAAAMDAGNLLAVGQAVRGLAPDAVILFLADNDVRDDGRNTGIEAARAAAVAVGGFVAIPELDGRACDWWDVWNERGAEVVADALQATIASPAEPAIADDVSHQPDEENAPAGDPESLFDAVTRLATLHPLEYEKLREAEANSLGVRIGVLDKEVGIARKARKEEGGKAVMFPEVKAWNEAVIASKLLKEIYTTIKQFIICENETAITATLWIAFTWIVDAVEVAPLAVITAPEKRCGKSQLLNLIGRLSRRPLVAANISPAATFRVIEAHSPTLLIDEADSFFKDNEELRGVINSGHTRQSAYVIRTVGDDHTPQQFSTWGAKAISGIGHLAETLMDRAVILELRRKMPNETVQRLRHAQRGLFDRLTSQLARFAEDASAAIGASRPDLPEALNDRAQDNWEPLLAIADYAGGDWPRIARDAALKLSGAEQEAVSLSAELLADIQEVFEHKRVDRISTADLLQSLTEDDIKPWATYNRGKPMSPRQLAKRLHEYGIQPRTIRSGYDTIKGFMRSLFDDAFSRYLTPAPHTPDLSVTTSQSATKPDAERVSAVTDGKVCDVTQNQTVTRKPWLSLRCDGVTDRSPVLAGGTVRVEV